MRSGVSSRVLGSGLFFFFFFLMAEPAACGSSWAEDSVGGAAAS